MKSSIKESNLQFLKNKRLTEHQCGTKPTDEAEICFMPLSHESVHDHKYRMSPAGRRSPFLFLMRLCSGLELMASFTPLTSNTQTLAFIDKDYDIYIHGLKRMITNKNHTTSMVKNSKGTSLWT